jgi:hypothetical protein
MAAWPFLYRIKILQSLVFFECGDGKAGPNIRDRVPEMTPYTRLLWARVHHRLALSFGSALDQDAAVPLPH